MAADKDKRAELDCNGRLPMRYPRYSAPIVEPDMSATRQIAERTVAKVSRFIAFSSCYDETNKTAHALLTAI